MRRRCDFYNIPALCPLNSYLTCPMRHILLALVLCASICVNAQNLLLNPGFETIDTSYHLPNPSDTFDVHNVVGWWNPGSGTTDYYNSDGKHAHCGSPYFGKEM